LPREMKGKAFRINGDRYGKMEVFDLFSYVIRGQMRYYSISQLRLSIITELVLIWLTTSYMLNCASSAFWAQLVNGHFK
jgi:hypothetical protein